MYTINMEDLFLVQQPVINYRIKIEVYDFEDRLIDVVEGALVTGSSSIDAESDIRRTCSITISPDSQVYTSIGENNVIWLDKKLKIYLGIQDLVSKEYTYWSQGVYIITNANATFDAVTNQIEIECSDLMSFLDGTRGGNLGTKQIIYPAYQNYYFNLFGSNIFWIKEIHEDTFRTEIKSLTGTFTPAKKTIFNFSYLGDTYDVSTDDSWSVEYINKNGDNTILNYYSASDFGIIGGGWFGDTGSHFSIDYAENEDENDPVIYNYIRDAIINAATELGGIKKYNVDWIGEAKAQPGYKKDWDYEWYRESTKVTTAIGDYLQCFTLPYDLEFSSDTSVLSILTKMRDLYENNEMFFDENGVFICKLIPSGDDDPIIFDYNFINSILISENLSLDFSEVKNVTEAWGKCFEPDWFTDFAATYNSSNNTYTVEYDGYLDSDHKGYYNGDEFAFKVNNTNANNPKLRIKSGTETLAAIDIIDENTEVGISAGVLVPNTIYTFKIKKTHVGGSNIIKAYLEGNWEVHAIDALTDGSQGEIVYVDDYECERYSKEYFQKVYNCENVHLTQIEDSPFTVQKLGIILKVYTNEDMTSDSLGTEGARQENYRSNRLTDNITITTKLCPFADVNQKITYQRSDKSEPEEYIIKHIDHDWSTGTTTWQLMKYYRLYLASEEDESEELVLISEYIPDGSFELYNKIFDFDEKTFYSDISYNIKDSSAIELKTSNPQPQYKTNTNMSLSILSQSGSSEYGFNITNGGFSSDFSQNYIVNIYDNGDTYSVNVNNLGRHLRVALNSNGLYINGRQISEQHISNVIQQMSIIGKIKIGGDSINVRYNKISLRNEHLSGSDMEKYTTILASYGNILMADASGEVASIDLGFTPKYIAVSKSQLTNTRRIINAYDYDSNQSKYVHAIYIAADDTGNSNRTTKNLGDTGKRRLNNIYNTRFTMNYDAKKYYQNYFAIADIDGLDLSKYNDKVAKGTMYLDANSKVVKYVNLGFKPKYLCITQSPTEEGYTKGTVVCIYNEDWNTGKFIYTISNSSTSEKSLRPSKITADMLYEITDTGFGYVQTSKALSYDYFAIG